VTVATRTELHITASTTEVPTRTGAESVVERFALHMPSLPTKLMESGAGSPLTLTSGNTSWKTPLVTVATLLKLAYPEV
jgi:hypothetical protein